MLPTSSGATEAWMRIPIDNWGALCVMIGLRGRQQRFLRHPRRESVGLKCLFEVYIASRMMYSYVVSLLSQSNCRLARQAQMHLFVAAPLYEVAVTWTSPLNTRSGDRWAALCIWNTVRNKLQTLLPHTEEGSNRMPENPSFKVTPSLFIMKAWLHSLGHSVPTHRSFPHVL